MQPDGQGKTIIRLGGSTFTFDLPRAISYQTEYGWESTELGTAGLLYDSHGGQMSLSSIIGNLSTEDLTSAVDRAFMQTNAFNAGALRSRETRLAPNPKEAILFKGVQFRSYSLEFMIAGDSSADVKEKAAYVNEMKVAAAPELTGKQYFFTYPDTGTLKITDGTNTILKPRDIAITSISTDLTPNGYFATWSKGGPISFNLEIGIMELHLPTKANDENILGFA